MFIFDNRITIENRKLLEKYLCGFDYKASAMSYTSMYMWRNINKYSFEIIGDYMCIAGNSHLELEYGVIEPFIFPPLTATGSYEPEKLRETILKAKRLFEEKGHEFSIRLLPLHMLDIIKAACPDEVKYTDDRPNYDYIYKKQDLIDLKGRQLHSKKNHLNYFNNNYEYEYVKITPDLADEAMVFIDEFNKMKDIPENKMRMLKLEEDAMLDVLKNIDDVGYLAGAILINDKIEAISIGGRLGKNTVTIHVEKANVGYRGLYQAINNEFCRHVAKNVEFINKEEDMGVINLRKAKLSYKPIKLLEKYNAVFKNS